MLCHHILRHRRPEGDRIFSEFLILADYKIRDNKSQIAGGFNGEIAALHVAAGNPQYFLSVTAFPGYMWEPGAAKLEAISQMCVFMYVGGHDSYIWHCEMKWKARFLRERGTVRTMWTPLAFARQAKLLASTMIGAGATPH